MTLTELRYIVALAHERHFGRAAERCFVSQPTLSVAVRKLEADLGVSIFERGAGEVSLTPIGERVIAQAQRALEEADAVKQVAQTGGDQLDGQLRIGAIYTVGPYLFPALIPILRRRTPSMPLIVEENFTAILVEKLKQGQLDVIVISLPFAAPGILTLPLYREPFVVLMPASHPLIERSSIRAADLKHETMLLLGAGHCFRDQVIEACPACAPRGDGGEARAVEGSSLETIRHMVVSGIGITVLPCSAAGADRYARRLLAIRRFAGKTPSRDVALAWRTTFPRPKVIDALRGAIAACQLSCTSPIADPQRRGSAKADARPGKKARAR
ncbi:MAG: LysR family transcriptional regulator [Chromatiales bacterium 21-64-14]|nr:MAG: LysR family transcriptional regulator [Chromatiales bacterium 21-64-14]HQU16172.1 LysR substrate-binding domain-containing protein [Gammaproteobacteria bacterium]